METLNLAPIFGLFLGMSGSAGHWALSFYGVHKGDSAAELMANGGIIASLAMMAFGFTSLGLSIVCGLVMVIASVALAHAITAMWELSITRMLNWFVDEGGEHYFVAFMLGALISAIVYVAGTGSLAKTQHLPAGVISQAFTVGILCGIASVLLERRFRLISRQNETSR